jgi:hypothetical protein
MTDNNGDFDFRLWLLETHISDKGLAKLATHEVKDSESLLALTDNDVKEMKLATADRAKFLKSLHEFLGKDSPGASHTSDEKDQSKSAENDNSIVTKESSEESSTPESGIQSAARYTIEEVANFMAGGALPAILNETLNNRQVISKASPVHVSPVQQATWDSPQQISPLLPSQYSAGVFPPSAGIQPSFGSGHLGSYQGGTGGFPAINYHPAQAYPYAQPQVFQQYPSTLPCYSPPQIANQPGRLPTTQTL